MYVLWLIVRNAKRLGQARNQVIALAGVLIAQIGLGILNVMLLAPVWLQIVHLLVAELFWILVVLASANLLFSPYEQSNKSVDAADDCRESPVAALIS
jgi:heme A synthase